MSSTPLQEVDDTHTITDMSKVLVIGSGGREHAIVDALARSSKVDKIYCAPGNAGIAEQAECVAIGVEDADSLLSFAKENEIDLTVVGPEAALAAGVADKFRVDDQRIVGPGVAGAAIEASKEFAKQLMDRHNIPTAGYEAFDNYEAAREYVFARPLPAVIKYDGLAAGKGVVVAMTYEEADEALRDMLLDSTFGQGRVVVEDFLDGPEFSYICLVNGRKVYPLALAQDHKRAYDGDKGPNTGGMGAYSPVPIISEEVRQRAHTEIMQATADALADEGIDYCGILYGGLILTAEGPKVIEFNARFGDPETEVILPRMESDFYDLLEAMLEQRDFDIRWSDDTMLGIVMAAEGYPGKYAKALPIDIPADIESRVFHMGTACKDGQLQSAGGRVMMVVGRGKTLTEARDKALRDVESINAPGHFWRKDIGFRSL